MAPAYPQNVTGSGSSKNPHPGQGPSQLQQTQAEVDEVVGIMQENVKKVLERDEKLNELDERVDALEEEATQFQKQAGRLERKMWCQNFKMTIILSGICIVILIVILCFLFLL